MLSPSLALFVKEEGNLMPRVINIRKEPFTDYIYAGRPGPLGNPYLIGRDGTREEVIDKHLVYFLSDPGLISVVRLGQGYNWGCYCAPLECHCDIYLHVANCPEDEYLEILRGALEYA